MKRRLAMSLGAASLAALGVLGTTGTATATATPAPEATATPAAEATDTGYGPLYFRVYRGTNQSSTQHMFDGSHMDLSKVQWYGVGKTVDNSIRSVDNDRKHRVILWSNKYWGGEQYVVRGKSAPDSLGKFNNKASSLSFEK